MPRPSSERPIRNYQVLLQRIGGLSAGRAGSSAQFATGRAAWPEGIGCVVVLAAVLGAVGAYTPYWWVGAIGALLVLIVVVDQLRSARRTADQSADDLRGMRSGGAGGRQGKTEKRIRERDPTFDANELVKRVSQAFLAMQAVWGEHQTESMRAFASDGTFERFRIARAEQQALGERNLSPAELDGRGACPYCSEPLQHAAGGWQLVASSDVRMGPRIHDLEQRLRAIKPASAH